jgi:ABC-2 type transport system ATP-binding protein
VLSFQPISISSIGLPDQLTGAAKREVTMVSLSDTTANAACTAGEQQDCTGSETGTPVILRASNLVKHFAGVRAVDGLSFDVAQGRCFGLLGPNGAGKTTSMEILEGILAPDEGSVHYQGKPLDHRFRQDIGIQFQATSLQDFQTVRETLDMFAAFYERGTDLAELAELCRLQEFMDRDTAKLSGGQRQRLLLAIALVNDPRLVFLDEPTTGLDPQSRRNFWSLIEGIKRAGKTVLLTTHYMEEAHRLCDEIAIVDKGRIIVQGAPDELLKQHFPAAVIRLPASALARHHQLPDDMVCSDGMIESFTDDVTVAIARLEGLGANLGNLKISAPTLEDLFLKLTGHTLRN